ncbi:acetolactate synthase small subunit [Marinococcus luteus]|uniref:acetolactate synthase small subunit n=1 Tax=Marinococcus luteus TaxID=1122204 RepID=UPI002ACCADA6|nr:acetolactate synthase small subunit [Marinococcus luteus]MDZ5783740.1 acetolactate synthase small subunit [Marinococcus luteus]
MRRTITATVNNTTGVMNRITGLFARRHFNIESITVGMTENPEVSRMTFVVNVSDQRGLDQVIKQLNKQVDVLKVRDITDEAIVARELAMIKVMTVSGQRGEISDLIAPFRATVIDVGRESVTIQVTGDTPKVEALIDLLRPYGIKEMARTGVTAFQRATKKSSDQTRYSIIN